jgi:hypothetical protein
LRGEDVFALNSLGSEAAENRNGRAASPREWVQVAGVAGLSAKVIFGRCYYKNNEIAWIDAIIIVMRIIRNKDFCNFCKTPFPEIVCTRRQCIAVWRPCKA